VAVQLSRKVIHETLEGTPTVFIHGVGSSLECWNAVIEHFDPPGPVVCYDLRGHGDSPKIPGPYDLDDFISDHVGLLAELGFDKANVVGFSLGGLIAQAIAIRRPESVERVAILGAIAGRTADERAAVLRRLASVEESGPAGTAAQGPGRWFTDGFAASHPEVVSRMMERLASTDRAGYEAAYRVLATNDLAAELHRILAPALVMTGEGDVGSPPHMSELMAHRIPNAELVIAEGTKHGMLEERPERVARELSRFLRGDKNQNGELRAAGLGVRSDVLGDEYVERAMKNVDPLSAEFQQFITQYCWGEIWTDDRLSRRDHSLLTLAMTAALGKTKELEAHTRGALRNGITPDELAAVLRQITVYCGVPAGVGAARAMRGVLYPDNDSSRPHTFDGRAVVRDGAGEGGAGADPATPPPGDALSPVSPDGA
jgi:pimeloyl-ACP methyl ester carboxylesterase/alkylhydroperoxidase/carboxymuconolactone decarboxylase family protein YurZ